jgi:hypothetical protein
MTDKERFYALSMERFYALREKYRGLDGYMPPFGDVIFLLRLVEYLLLEAADERSKYLPTTSKAPNQHSSS